MELVQPIRDEDMIQKFKVALKKQCYRDYLLFIIGINTGLRISDILNLKVYDVRDRTHIGIVEKKTGKKKRFLINPRLREDIEAYTEGMGDKEYLFQSIKGSRGNVPITRVQAYRILNKAAKRLGVKEIGTHTLRKTFGYHHYQRNKDVALLQNLFNHSSPSVTLRYIGLDQDMMDNTIEDFYL